MFALRALPIAVLLCWFVPSIKAQLREDFETPDKSWRFLKSDCQARVLRHARTFREAHTGQASEHLQLLCGAGTHAYLAFDVGQVPVIRELKPSLWLKSDRAGVQLLVRVVLPRTRHPATGKPLAVFLRGDSYRQAGLWQRLQLSDIQVKLERQVRTLRIQHRRPFDPRQAFVDAVVVNAYARRGKVSLWIDDLEIQQAVSLPKPIQVRPSVGGSSSATNSASPTAVANSRFLVGGRPRFVRMVDYNGEAFQLLSSLGFNTVKLSVSATREQLAEAERLKLWIVSPPPPSGARWQSGSYPAVIAWSLGRRLSQIELNATRQLANEIRRNGDRRPLFCSVQESVWSYSRVANVLSFERPTLLSSSSLTHHRQWLARKGRLTQLGQVVWATIDTEAPPKLLEQWRAYLPSKAISSGPTVDQMRMQCLESLAAGVRGLWFRSARRLDMPGETNQRRKQSIHQLLRELKVIEPWIAGGTLGPNVRSADPWTRVSVIKTARSQLVLARRHQHGQQHVMGDHEEKRWDLLLPGSTSPSANVFLIRPGVQVRVRPRRTAGGTRISLPPSNHAIVFVSHDPLAFHHVSGKLRASRADTVLQHYENTLSELREVQRVTAELGLLTSAYTLPRRKFSIAASSLSKAQQSLDSNDFAQADKFVLRSRNLLDQIRREQWNLATRRFPHPSTSPFTFCYPTLAQHFELQNRLDRFQFSGNSLAGGGMENLKHMLNVGWQRLDRPQRGTAADVVLTQHRVHSGRSSCYVGARRKGEATVPERPLVVLRSSPVRVRAGDLVRFSGWIRIDQRLPNDSDGLHVFETLGGPSLGQILYRTRGWQRFEFVRFAPANMSVRLYFQLGGFGSAFLDDAAIVTASR